MPEFCPEHHQFPGIEVWCNRLVDGHTLHRGAGREWESDHTDGGK